MKKLVFVFIIFSTLLILGACKDQSLEKEINGVQQEETDDAQLSNEKLQNAVWSKAYDRSQLHQAVQQQMERWVQTDREIPYYIQNKLDQDQTEVVGLFRSTNDWELKGKTKEEQVFVLKSNEDTVTLEYDEYKEELSKVEFEFLLPLKHLDVLEELLNQNKYEFMKWTEKNEGWSVQVHSSTEPINEAFVQFLLSHLTSSQSIGESGFEAYSLTYDLQLDSAKEKLVIKSLQFSLEKEGEILEQILFHF